MEKRRYLGSLCTINGSFPYQSVPLLYQSDMSLLDLTGGKTENERENIKL
jgi:hypothetical protein